MRRWPATTEFGRARIATPLWQPYFGRPQDSERPCPRPRLARISGPALSWDLPTAGVEANLWGIFGVKIGWIEGLEINLLSVVAGLDLRQPALKLPGFGQIDSAAALP